MLDPVRIRFRTGSSFRADDAARVARGLETKWHDREELAGVEPAQPGDCWRTRWMLTDAQKAAGMTEGYLAGYDIFCPKCLSVHHWGTARNCSQKTGDYCVHYGVGSCWNWTGSAEDGTLSASPSLHCDASIGGCGWHGFLTNGVLKHC